MTWDPSPTKHPRYILETLGAYWPGAFAFDRPLKLDIHLDILANLPAGMEPADLGRAMRYKLRDHNYLRALRAGVNRYDLHGKVTGRVTKEEAEEAHHLLVESLQYTRNGGASAER